MYGKILVAIDDSPRSKAVFDHALSLAQSTQSSLVLLHILSADGEDSPFSFAPMTLSYNPEIIEQYQKQWREFEEKCQAMLKTLTEEAQDKGVSTEYHQLNGYPGRLICKFAQDQDIDLIIMGRRGHSTLQEMFMGSVSSYVLHRSHCSVLIVQ